jgi:hypothetical protein
VDGGRRGARIAGGVGRGGGVGMGAVSDAGQGRGPVSGPSVVAVPTVVDPSSILIVLPASAVPPIEML